MAFMNSIYKCPKCHGGISSSVTNNTGLYYECKGCGQWTYDYLSGFWQGYEAAQIKGAGENVLQHTIPGSEDFAQIAALLDGINLSLLENYTFKDTVLRIKRARQLLPC